LYKRFLILSAKNDTEKNLLHLQKIRFLICHIGITEMKTQVIKSGRMLAILLENQPLSSCEVTYLGEISNE